MTEPELPWDEIRNDVVRLGVDLRQMLTLRWQLAWLEVRADLASTRRLAIVLAAVAVMALTALPVLTVCAADVLDQRLGIPRIGWLLTFGLVLLGSAPLIGWLAWSRFRRRLVALEETLEELREDLVWLREWTGRTGAEPEGGRGKGEGGRRKAEAEVNPTADPSATE
jgi:hypothetical protein